MKLTKAVAAYYTAVFNALSAEPEAKPVPVVTAVPIKAYGTLSSMEHTRVYSTEKGSRFTELNFDHR